MCDNLMFTVYVLVASCLLCVLMQNAAYSQSRK